jgi:pilus assembly protein CpaE
VIAADVGGGAGERVVAVLISTDPEFRTQMEGILSGPDGGVDVRLSIVTPFTAIGDPEISRIGALAPGLVIVDLESDPHIGLRFIQYLVDTGVTKAIIAAGKDLSQDLLMQAMQAGVTEVLAKPITEEQVTASLQRIWRKTGRKVEETTRSAPGRVIALFGTKGGVGTSSLAVNLAVEIQRMTRKRTLLLDLDIELGETALMLGMEPKFSLTDLIRNFHRVDSGLLASYIEHHDSGIDLLAAPFQPGDYETVGQDRVRQVIRFLRGQYDYVVMDTPKNLHPASIGGLEEADEVFLITTPTLPAIRNLVRSLPLVQQLVGEHRKDKIKLVLNRFQPGDLISVREVEETVGLPVLHTIRNDFEAVMGGINEGSPAVLRGQSAYAKGVRGLAGIITDTPVVQNDRKGLFGGLIGALKDGRS